MNKKIIISLGIFAILLIGFSTAGIVKFISNTIDSEFKITQATFYTDSGQTLSLNEEPSNGEWVDISSDAGCTELTWELKETLDPVTFEYSPHIKFTFAIETTHNYTKNPAAVELEFGLTYLDDDNSYFPGGSFEICSTDFLSIEENGTYTFTCKTLTGDYPLENIESFYYSFSPITEDDYMQTKTKETYVEILAPSMDPK